MIENNYIFEINFKYDLKIIQLIALKNQFKRCPELALHQRHVSEEPYFVLIKKDFPFLSDIYNIYTIPGKGNIPMHVDSARNCAFNIPIKNTHESDTIFYKFNKNLSLKYDQDRVYDLVESDVEEVFRFTLIRPTLIDNSVPHEMINRSESPRIIMSWSVSKEYSFEDAKAFFKRIY